MAGLESCAEERQIAQNTGGWQELSRCSLKKARTGKKERKEIAFAQLSIRG
jgi:hypothetical protein